MRLLSFSTGFIALLPTFVTSTSLILTFPPSNLIQNPASLPSTTHATLTSSNETFTALLTKSNTITFAHIPAGSYLCDVYTRDYNVVPLRVDVRLPESAAAKAVRRGWERGDIEVWQTFRGNEWGNRGEKLCGENGACNVNLKVVNEKKFYEERSGFSPMSLLQNPMILMGVVGLGIMLGMPKLMENMDPEMREEFEKQQKSSPLTAGLTGGNPMGGFDMASWMAGSKTITGGEETRNTGTDTGSNKAKRRG